MAKFRLATLLKLRERDRDMAAKALQDVHLAIDKLDTAQSEIDEANSQMNEARKQSSFGAINLNQILDAQRYQMVLAAQSAQIAEHKGKLTQELERRQFALVQSQKAVKSLEKLRDQRDQAADLHALARQQERLDEWSSIRHAMTAIREEQPTQTVTIHNEKTRRAFFVVLRSNGFGSSVHSWNGSFQRDRQSANDCTSHWSVERNRHPRRTVKASHGQCS